MLVSTVATSQACAAAAAWRTLPPPLASIVGITRGSPITAATTSAATAVGIKVEASEASPGIRRAVSSTPKMIRAPKLTALVTMKRTAERLTAKAVGMPERIRIRAPSASPPLPPLGRKTLALSSTTPTSKDSRQPSRRSKAPRRATTKLSTESSCRRKAAMTQAGSVSSKRARIGCRKGSQMTAAAARSASPAASAPLTRIVWPSGDFSRAASASAVQSRSREVSTNCNTRRSFLPQSFTNSQVYRAVMWSLATEVAPETDTAALPASVLIARVARLVRSRLEAALGPSGLRQRQLVALSYLRDRGPARQQALAQSLCMDASSLVCLLNDLEDEDLIARKRDRADRRRGILELTDRGRAVLAEVDAALREIDAEILFDLDEAERTELRSLLGRLGGVGPDPA